MTKALLFVNGEPPKRYPVDLEAYQYVACTDGAYHSYLSQTSIIPHFIIGDLDSLTSEPIDDKILIIHRPDQNTTDFEKSLLFLAEKGITKFDIYGSTGNASDHFLGNISVAMRHYHNVDLVFYDNYCYFFFAKKKTVLSHVKNKTISLIALSKVESLTITGFKYPLTNQTLELNGLTSLRNQAITDQVTIDLAKGDLLIFISHE